MIFLRGNVPSLKNGKIKGIYHPKTVTAYLRSLNIQSYSASRKEVKGYKDINKPNLFMKQIGDYLKDIEYPLLLGIHPVRDSLRSADFNNLSHIISDLLTAHDLIKDDNMRWFFPVPFKINGEFYSIDRDNPGVWLTILNKNDFLDIKIPVLKGV